jgi:gas vesicle protein
MNDSKTSKDLSPNARESLGNIQDQLATYGSQIQEYLKTVKAEISDYKFAVEKSPTGLDIDVRFKAQVTMKET